jgi:hypothetical protein
MRFKDVYARLEHSCMDMLVTDIRKRNFDLKKKKNTCRSIDSELLLSKQ